MLKDASITVRIKPSTRQRIDALATAQKRTRSYLVEEVLEHYLDNSGNYVQETSTVADPHAGYGAFPEGTVMEYNMTTPAMKTELMHHVSRLPVAMQCQVLQFARSLERTIAAGVNGLTLASFAGSIPIDDLKIMAQAIDDGCERVDLDEW